MKVSKLKPYAKALVALAAFVGLFGGAIADGVITEQETGNLVTSAIGVIGVYLIPNKKTEE